MSSVPASNGRPATRCLLKLEGDWYNFGKQPQHGRRLFGGRRVRRSGAIIAPGETTTKSTIWEIKGGVNFPTIIWFGRALIAVCSGLKDLIVVEGASVGALFHFRDVYSLHFPAVETR